MLGRLSTIMHADKIVAMSDGRIAEIGTHVELLEKRGLYYHLYMAQFSHALSAHESVKNLLGDEETDELGRNGAEERRELATR